MAEKLRRSVVDSVTALAEVFGRTASEVTLRAYQSGLTGLSDEQVGMASAKALRQCRFMPTPAELRELAGEAKTEDRAQRAWASFDAALSGISVYKTVTFDDVVINAVVRAMGGIALIIELPAKEYFDNFRVRWLRCYESFARAMPGPEQCGPLLGYYDQQNQTSSEPLVIATGLPPLANAPRIGQAQPVNLGFDRSNLLKRIPQAS